LCWRVLLVAETNSKVGVSIRLQTQQTENFVHTLTRLAKQPTHNNSDWTPFIRFPTCGVQPGEPPLDATYTQAHVRTRRHRHTHARTHANSAAHTAEDVGGAQVGAEGQARAQVEMAPEQESRDAKESSRDDTGDTEDTELLAFINAATKACEAIGLTPPGAVG